jgi:two-component system, NtrC family, response regulator PilR
VRQRLLIVEDEPVLRKNLVRLFLREGFDVATAGTCAEAVRQLVATRFSGLLLDISLPDGDGFDLLVELGEEHRPPLTIVMTAFSTPENEARADLLRVHRLLPKPVDLGQLVATVRDETTTPAA